jgi:hypothetical protein
MKRRTILRRASALGLVATAGCLSGATPGTDSNDDRNESGEDQSGDDRTESGDDAPETKAVADATVETVATRCASDEAPTGTVSVDEAATAVTFSGVLTAGTPCHEVVVDDTEYHDEYDAEGDRLGIVLATDPVGEACVECVGALEYEGSVSLEGELPADAYVAHGDAVLASTDDHEGTETSGDDSDSGGDGTPTLVEAAFEVDGTTPGDDRGDTDVRFDADATSVVVDGTIRGSDGCQTAELAAADYDPQADELSVDVRTVPREGSDDEMCTQSTVQVDYLLRAEFKGSLPSSATVSHDGQAVVSAGHDSATASESAETQ